jgi:hypothetical protein
MEEITDKLDLIKTWKLLYERHYQENERLEENIFKRNTW